MLAGLDAAPLREKKGALRCSDGFWVRPGGHLGRKWSFALDHQAYQPGPPDTKTKELLGLVTSRDDSYLVRAGEVARKRDELIDALNVLLVMGGSITVPHLRRPFATMREIPGLQHEVK